MKGKTEHLLSKTVMKIKIWMLRFLYPQSKWNSTKLDVLALVANLIILYRFRIQQEAKLGVMKEMWDVVVKQPVGALHFSLVRQNWNWENTRSL